MPSPEDFYKTLKNPRMYKFYAPDNEKKFGPKQKFIYMAFFSHASPSVGIQVRFTTEEEAIGKKKVEEITETFNTKK
jgi:hypothetical protein